MGRLEVAVNRGSVLQLYQAMWGPLYEAVLNILGSTGVILPIGDPKHGQPNATTFTTVGEEQVTFTWSEAPASFDTPLDLASPDSWQGIIPVVDFNGTDEEADSPDAAYWTRALAAMSVGAWVNTTAATGTILGKFDYTNDRREWVFNTSTLYLKLTLYDEDDASNSYILTLSDVAIVASTWTHVVATYNGSADASGINIYINGALVASTDTDQAGFTSMRDKAGLVTLGFADSTVVEPFDGYMAGGPLGPFFVQAELGADQVKRLYEIGRRALGL